MRESAILDLNKHVFEAIWVHYRGSVVQRQIHSQPVVLEHPVNQGLAH